MSVKKAATSAVVVASLLAANLSPLATAASAKDWHRHNGRPYAHVDHGPKHFRGKRHVHHKHHRDRSGKDFAKGLAIGLGILALGSIIASEAHR